jgi:hypothetical protein
MAYPAYVREKARQLRIEKRLTIDELAERLAISRTTVFYWVRDLPIPGSRAGWPESARRKGNAAMQAKYRAQREAAYEAGERCFHDLAQNATFRDFVALYMAEGYKRSRNSVSLGNSDPAIVKLATRWMRGLSRNPVGFQLQFHADQCPNQLRLFWGGELSAEPASIALQRKSNSNQLKGRNWRSRYGVLTARTNDTLFRARLEAWMDCLRASWE